MGIIRNSAWITVALTSWLIGWVWSQVPWTKERDDSRVAVTFDAAVGMIDLYLKDEYRGFERLVEVDPRLCTVGRDAARTVAVDRRFDLNQRVAATKLLAENSALDGQFNSWLAASSSVEERPSFTGIDDGLDTELGLIPDEHVR